MIRQGVSKMSQYLMLRNEMFVATQTTMEVIQSTNIINVGLQ